MIQREFMESFDTNTGEQIADTEATEDKMSILGKQVAAKKAGYVKFLKSGKLKDLQKRGEDMIANINREITQISFRETMMKKTLHHSITEEGSYMTIFDEETGKPDLYVTPSFDIKRTVDMEKVPGNCPNLQYSLPKLTIGEYESVMSAMNHSYMTINGSMERSTIISAMRKFTEDAVSSIGVKALQEIDPKHPAIKEHLTPTVKITKTLPQELKEKAA